MASESQRCPEFGIALVKEKVMSNRNLYLMRVMLTALTSALGLAAAPSQAQLTDLSSTPLSSAANLSVLPNLLFTLDASGSMSFDYITDNVGVYDSLDNTTNYMCKTDANGNNACMRMDPPFSAAQVNGVGYNPQTTYRPAFKFDGTTYPKQSSSSSVLCDPFNGQTCKAMYQAYFKNTWATGTGPART
jgi:type IV pilus assembly protein PilY1